MQTELHNDTEFHPKPFTMQAKPPNKTSMNVNNLAFQPHNTKIPTVNEINNHKDT